MDRRINHRTGRTLGAAAAGVALALAAVGCSADGSSGESTSPAESTAPAASTPAASSAASPAAGSAQAATSTPAAPSKQPTAAAQQPTLDTVSNQQHKFAVVATGSADVKGSETLASKLIIADHGCFHAVNKTGAPTLLVFPEGTQLNSQGQPSVTVGGTTYRVGERLDVTGQKITLDQEQAAQASPCRSHGDVFQIAAAK